MPLLQWMLLVLSLLGAAFAHAEVLVLDTQVKRTLDAEIRYLEDPHHTLTLETLPGTPEAWTRNAETTFNKGYSTSAWWLRLTFTNPTDHPQTRYLEIAYAVIDNLQVYIQRDQAPLERHQLGDKQPYHQRLVDHPMFVIPLEWQPGETLTLTLRVVSTGAIQTPMVLWDKAVFQGHSLTYNTLQGFYFGAMFIIAAYNLLLFFTLGERSYLYYVGFVSCMALFLSALTGQAFRYLWPYMTQWNDQAIIVFLAGTLFFGGLFTKQFLKLREFSRGLNLYCIALAVASALIAAAVEWLTYPQLIRLLVPMASITCISFISIGVYAWWRHQPSAKYYCIAWTLLLTSGVILALSKHDVIPSNLLIDHIVQFSSLLEVLLLSFALAERINIERRLRFEAQHDSLLASKRLNEELEERVRERTRELEKLNERLNELSNTDQLTGLKNRRYLEQALQDAWAHKRAQGGLLSVVLMDIDHFKRINDTHGHPAGDACLKAVAGMIREGLHWPGDVAARFGGEEFCILLPNTPYDAALTVIERIRQQIAGTPVRVEGKDIHLTISAGICTVSPAAFDNAERALKLADTALYQAKANGRNRTESLHPTAEVQ